MAKKRQEQNPATAVPETAPEEIVEKVSILEEEAPVSENRDAATDEPVTLDLLAALFVSVLIGRMTMADARRAMADWWLKLSPADRRKIAVERLQYCENIRRIGDGIYEEFFTISINDRD